MTNSSTSRRKNQLHLPVVLEKQVHRMLADAKAGALTENFGDQLLYLRNLPSTSPDGLFYPNWDDELRKGFRKETELLFESIIKENRSVKDLLDADCTLLMSDWRSTTASPTFMDRSFAASRSARSWPIAVDCWDRGAYWRSPGSRTSAPRR